MRSQANSVVKFDDTAMFGKGLAHNETTSSLANSTLRTVSGKHRLNLSSHIYKGGQKVTQDSPLKTPLAQLSSRSNIEKPRFVENRQS